MRRVREREKAEEGEELLQSWQIWKEWWIARQILQQSRIAYFGDLFRFMYKCTNENIVKLRMKNSESPKSEDNLLKIVI